MITLNLAAYLDSRGVKLKHGFIREAVEDLGIHRATLTKYLRHSHNMTSIDLRILGELGEYLCRRFPDQLNLKDLLHGIIVWESFPVVFARSLVRYYIGAVVLPEQSGHEPMTSPRDRSVVDNLHLLQAGEKKDIVFVRYRLPKEFGTLPLASEIAAAEELMKKKNKDEPLVRVLVGSCKVHLLTILHLGELFGVDAFDATNDRMPIGLVPRPGEIVPGCFLNTQSSKPGLLWRNKDNVWEHLGFEEDESRVTRDAGIVVMDYRPDTQELNVILFGFSGAGTRAAGYALANNPQTIKWPPKNRGKDAFVDIYAWKFDFTDERHTVTNFERMDEKVLVKYLPVSAP